MSTPAARTLRLLGKGTDSTGGSVASMDIGARIEPATDGRSTLVGTSVVSMSGKAAAFGGRMMNTVADQILKQFADNFAAQVGAIQASARPLRRRTGPARSLPPLPPRRHRRQGRHRSPPN